MADRFPLVMDDGSEVDENLEELKEKFDVNSIVGHFLAGRLEEWLRARYFDEKADEVAALDKDAEDLGRQLCEIFGVDTGNVDDVDVGYIERLNEKKNILRQKTADERIIANANLTAFTQTDLADLLDLNEPVIYLCGKKFNIPIRIEHKIYKGILGQPKIDINAKSEAELKEHDIKFENVELPFRSCRESVAENIYERRGSEKENNGQEAVDNFVQIINKSEVTSTINNENPISSNASYSQRRLKYTAFIKNFVKEFHIWNIATTRDRVSYEPTTEEKLVCIETVCQGKCHEEDILYLAVTSDFSAGLAFREYEKISVNKIFYG